MCEDVLYWCARDVLVCEGCIGVRGMYLCARDVLVCEGCIGV